MEYFDISENEQAEALEETSPRSVELLDPTLQENSCVELQISGKLRYGVIRWIGKDINVWGDVLFAGLELVSRECILLLLSFKNIPFESEVETKYWIQSQGILVYNTNKAN